MLCSFTLLPLAKASRIQPVAMRAQLAEPHLRKVESGGLITPGDDLAGSEWIPACGDRDC